MSAIWGYIDFSKKINTDKIGNCLKLMGDGYKECAIDRLDITEIANGFFACGLQFFSDRAEKETLPILDSDHGYLFTADVVLNGRKTLAEEIAANINSIHLGSALEQYGETITDGNFLELPDGILSYISWLIWKEKFVDHIIGMFAIAVYDIGKNEFYMFADHMGTRCINYCSIDGEVFFSTLTKPIADVMPRDYYGINERFIAGCECNSNPDLCLFPGDTPFENIYQLCRGRFIKVSSKGADIKEYWNPLKNKSAKSSSEGNYPNIFRKTFFECVEDAIDTEKNVAATISSGLDSTSVAGVAAIKLGKQDRTLYGFTQVPDPDYVSDYAENVVTDETKGVKVFLEKYPNIEHCFDRYEGKSSFTELDRIVRMTEIPVKAMTNMVWIDDILSKARKKDCRVLLIGQFGNGTISRGNIYARVYEELTQGHFKEAKKQLAAFGKRCGIPRKMLLKYMTDELINKKLFDLGINSGFNDTFDKRYLRHELLENYRIRQAYRQQVRKNGFGFFVRQSQANAFVMDPTVAQTISIYDTKLSLYHGIIIKDPTRDKRIVELIMGFPCDQFCEDGLERRLVREHLSDIVPAPIRLDPGHRGLQGADAAFRVLRYGTEKLQTKFDDRIWQYLNKENVEKLFNEGRLDTDNYYDIVRILALNSFVEGNKKVV